MCIIIVCPPGENIPDIDLWAAIDQNRDGAGYAFAIHNEIVMDRDALDPKRIVEGWLKVRAEYPHAWGMFHARIATQGSLVDANTHPFMVPGRDWALMHNGIMDLSDGPWGDRSDSRIFAEDHISQHSWRELQSSKGMVEDWLGSNKVVVLSARKERGGRCIIYNENKGHWSGISHCWFSHYQSTYKYTGHAGSAVGAYGTVDDWDDWESYTGAKDYRHPATEQERSRATLGIVQELPREENGPEDGHARLLEAARVLGISEDDLEAWVRDNPDDAEAIIAEMCGEDDGPDLEATDTDDGPTIIPGAWDPDTRLYYGEDGSLWIPDEANPGLIVQVNLAPDDDGDWAKDWDSVCEWCGVTADDCVCWNAPYLKTALANRTTGEEG